MFRLTLVRIAWASARSRMLTLSLMIATVALTTALLVTTERLRQDVRTSFAQALSGTDLIVAARSHPIQVLLSSVFHIGAPSQNVSRTRIESLVAIPQVDWVVPIALGDSYRGMPVVATSAEYFVRVRTGDSRPLEFVQGRPFEATGPQGLTEVVLGATVAARFGLGLTDRVTLAHGGGVISDGAHDDHPFQVVGVLRPTGTPIDRTVLISLQAFQALHAGWVGGVPPRAKASGREARTPALANAPDDALPLPPSLSAAMIGLKSRATVFSVQRTLERAHPEPLTAVLPGVALDQLWQLLGHGETLLRWMSVIVGITALAGLVSTILAGLESRRRELAILRALGARPRSLFTLVLMEASLAGLLGIVAGVLLSIGTLAMLQPYLSMDFGVTLSADWFSGQQAGLLAAVFGATLVASLLPAWRAVALSLADGLAPPH